MGSRGLVSAGVGLYVAAMVAQAPATLADTALQRASNGRLRLTQAQGTVWLGAGSLEIREGGLESAMARKLAWRISPESLWRGRLVCDVQLEGATRGFPLAVALSKVEVGDVEFSLPAAALAIAEPRLRPLRLSGDVLLKTEKLSVGRHGMLGNLTLQWQDAGSVFAPVSPIGSYELKLEGQGKNVNAVMQTLEGPLQIEGSGAWAAGKKPVFLATVQVPAPLREQFTPLLRLISLQRDEGTFELQLK